MQLPTSGLSDGLMRRVIQQALDVRSTRLGTTSSKAPFERYRDDPIGHMMEVQGWRPWDSSDSPTGAAGQREVIEALHRDRMATVVTCNGYGKTSLASRIVLWFVSSRVNAIMLGVMPTWRQVIMQQFAHVRDAHARSRTPMPGKPDTYKWALGPMWYAHGFSTDKEEYFQGFHAATDEHGEAGDMLIIVDEAGGVAELAFNAIRGFTTRGNCYVLLLGNGNCDSGTYYASHHTLKTYRRFQASAYDCPEWIISRDWIREREEERDAGEITQDQFTIRVEGGFRSKGGINQLFPRWLLEKCADLTPDEPDELHMGCDISREGSDLNVVALVRKGVVRNIETWQSHDLMATAKNIMLLQDSWGVPSHCVHVDTVGMGAGVVDRLRESGRGVDAVDAGSKPKGDWDQLVGASQKFLNRKAELYWATRLLMLQGRLAVPREHRKVWRQLQWLRCDFREGSDVMFIERKEVMKKRLGISESPDFAEAVILAMSRAGLGRMTWSP